MFKKTFALIAAVFLLIISVPFQLEARIDFGLTIFGIEEIKFNVTKDADLNFHLLKKYLGEQENSVYPQLQAVERWFELVRMSDLPRQEQLIESAASFFKPEEKTPDNTRLAMLYFHGLLLTQDIADDVAKDEAFEEMLFSMEDSFSENFDYWLIKGLLFTFLKDRNTGYWKNFKPQTDLSRAMDLLPENAHSAFVLAEAFRSLDHSEANLFVSVATYEKAAQLDSPNKKLQNYIFGVYMGIHDDYAKQNKRKPFWLEEAVYKKILLLMPDNANALNNLGYLYAEYSINRKEAQALCERAVALAPNNPSYLDSLGWASYKNGNYTLAEKSLLASLRIKEKSYEANYHLATLYYSMRRYNDAMNYYLRALELKPGAPESLNNLAYLYLEVGTSEKDALEMAQDAVKQEPGNPSYLDTLGWAYFKNGILDKAEFYLKKAINLIPNEPEILLHMAHVNLEKKDFDAALSYAKEAYKNNPAMKDPENTLYMAVQLKALYTALADYHGIMGKQADLSKVLKIMNAIAALYQEEGKYAKVAEINNICSDLRSGKISLEEPIFTTYMLASPPKIGLKEESQKVPLPQETKEQPAVEQQVPAKQESFKPAGKRERSDFYKSVPENDYSMSASFGPSFFIWLSQFGEFAENFQDKKLSLIVKNQKLSPKALIVKLESQEEPGIKLLQMFYASFNTMNANVDWKDGQFKLALKNSETVYFQASKASVYYNAEGFLSREELDRLDSFLSPFNEDFLEMTFNREAFLNSLPVFLRICVEPFLTFREVYMDAAFLGDTFKAFIIAEAENEQSLEQQRTELQKDLMNSKLIWQKRGIDMSVIMEKGEGDRANHAYLTLLFHNLPEAFKDIFDSDSYLNKVLKWILNLRICELNRFFSASHIDDFCPENGLVQINPMTCEIKCSIHGGLVVPLILNSATMCNFHRYRLSLMLKLSNQNLPKADEERFVKELAEKFNLAPCPDGGSWYLKDGTVRCTKHEN
ncbi:MAG: tetratricopeptide repeat protein [Candidatus Riflebacteria bacterium]|nr:tetratricopeptide repeat protein [Candidatus Riflebacteria bacterium]